MDFGAKAQELELERAEYLSLVRLFLTHADEDVAELERAFAATDFAAIERAAHSLKGVTGNLVLLDLYDAAAKITETARLRRLDGIDVLLLDLRRGINEISKSLAEQEAP